MRKFFIYITLFILLILLTACNGKHQQGLSKADLDELQSLEPKSQEDVQSDNHFSFSVKTDKAVYVGNEPVKLEGEITYIGDLPEVTLGHSSSAVFFDLEEKMRSYRIDGFVNDIGLETKLSPGDVLLETYQKSGGYGDDEDEAYINFMNTFWEEDGYPAGYYIVKAKTDFYVRELDEYIQLEATIDFVVRPD